MCSIRLQPRDDKTRKIPYLWRSSTVSLIGCCSDLNFRAQVTTIDSETLQGFLVVVGPLWIPALALNGPPCLNKDLPDYGSWIYLFLQSNFLKVGVLYQAASKFYWQSKGTSKLFCWPPQIVGRISTSWCQHPVQSHSQGLLGRCMGTRLHDGCIGCIRSPSIDRARGFFVLGVSKQHDVRIRIASCCIVWSATMMSTVNGLRPWPNGDESRRVLKYELALGGQTASKPVASLLASARKLLKRHLNASVRAAIQYSK